MNQTKVAEFNLLQVSSNKLRIVSSDDSLFFLSYSISVLTLLTTSLKVSKIYYSPSSLNFLS